MVIFPISIFSQIRSERGGVWIFHIFPNLNYFAIILQYYLYKKCLHFKFFPISVEGGGVIENQIFPKFKIVQIILGGGGVKKIMDFFHNLWHFLFGRLPLVNMNKMSSIL